MTGGRIGADDFVFGEGDPSTNAGEDQTETIEAPTAAEQRALWLRQVTTEPADFLAAKFAYQAAMQDATAGNAQ